ncbi:helix-turn-helix domain-containing protein [Parashewanella tropica]|uniref:helix-turn-helix domain-containing protein n=1 Tax=Parashewanella tropica TaxID=2547970 RepID=UPI00105A35EB|nr:helix-turn-helix domain-containing protein [Parashewanella tropica]
MTARQRHGNATTTPEMRKFIQTSELTVSELSKILNISQATVRKWRNRKDIEDGDHTPHHLNTTLSAVEEYVVVGLRVQLKLSLDKLLKITQEFINPNVSRSGLARCLKRYGFSRGEQPDLDAVPEPFFNALPVVEGSDISQYTLNAETLAEALNLPSADGDTVVQVMAFSVPDSITKIQPTSVFIGTDSQSDWVYIDIYQDNETQASNRYISYVLEQGPFHLRKLLVKNYQSFLARFPDANTQIVPKRTRPTATAERAKASLFSGDSA